MEIKYRTQLPDLLRHFKLPMIACVCGVAEGYDSADLLRNGIEKLYMIDLWESHPEIPGDAGMPQEWHDKNYFEALKRIEAYSDRVHIVHIIKSFTSEAAKRIPNDSLSLCYIDACHDYFHVTKDMETYLPKLVNGGIMALHDYLAPQYGVNSAVKDFCKDKFEIHLIPENKDEDAGCWFIKK
jgi:hypothetical protein